MKQEATIEEEKEYTTLEMMRKDIIVQRLKERGYRITKQRLMLLDVILEEECSSCKEIHCKAAKLDQSIGTATVYRMINTLEEIGAINRKNMYRIACGKACDVENACIVEFDDGAVIQLSGAKWHQVIQSGLQAFGYMNGRNVRSVVARGCECPD